MANRLAREKSPYLLQHATNPVDWYPWGEEAFEKAKNEDKPILLSVGYSTCHWCHVMERESFSDPDTAELMNRDFVAIKLDREERPDVDRVYMTAVQAMTGQGGWPLNVFLTPDLKPFFGGTYFPPDGRHGRPGFPQLLGRIAELWRTRRKDLDADAKNLAEAVARHAGAGSGEAAPEAVWLANAERALAARFDEALGGFGGAPKFPMPANLFLLARRARAGSKDAASMLSATLSAMARGGIHDQVGGGFHRYSTDARWHIPHFEKMLYDNAQLASVYVEAWQLTGDGAFAEVARATLDYALRDLRHPDGGFYSAEDADSLPPELVGKVEDKGHEHRTEGAFYLWTTAELDALLGADAESFKACYGAAPDGNAEEDPHGEFTGKNILFQAQALDQAAEKAGATQCRTGKALDAARAILLEARAKRPRPSLDDKVLASWNGLMLSALAKAGAAFEDARFLDAAQACARFLRKNLWEEKGGRLWHRWRDGERAVPGMADDYAFLAQGLLDLFEADGDPAWLDWAEALADGLDKRFSAPGGGYFMTEEGHDPRLLARVVEDQDNVEPAAASVAAMVFLRLERFTGRKDLRERAERTLSRFGKQMADHSLSLPQMLCAVDLLVSPPVEIVIAGKADDDARALRSEVSRRFLPNAALIRLTPANKKALSVRLPFLASMDAAKPAAYVCSNYACDRPTSDPKELAQQLDAHANR